MTTFTPVLRRSFTVGEKSANCPPWWTLGWRGRVRGSGYGSKKLKRASRFSPVGPFRQPVRQRENQSQSLATQALSNSANCSAYSRQTGLSSTLSVLCPYGRKDEDCAVEIELPWTADRREGYRHGNLVLVPSPGRNPD